MCLISLTVFRVVVVTRITIFFRGIFQKVAGLVSVLCFGRLRIWLFAGPYQGHFTWRLWVRQHFSILQHPSQAAEELSYVVDALMQTHSPGRPMHLTHIHAIDIHRETHTNACTQTGKHVQLHTYTSRKKRCYLQPKRFLQLSQLDNTLKNHFWFQVEPYWFQVEPFLVQCWTQEVGGTLIGKDGLVVRVGAK